MKYLRPSLQKFPKSQSYCATGSQAANIASCANGASYDAGEKCSPGNTRIKTLLACSSTGSTAKGGDSACSGNGNSAVGYTDACVNQGNSPENTGNFCWTGFSPSSQI